MISRFRLRFFFSALRRTLRRSSRLHFFSIRLFLFFDGSVEERRARTFSSFSFLLFFSSLLPGALGRVPAALSVTMATGKKKNVSRGKTRKKEEERVPSMTAFPFFSFRVLALASTAALVPFSSPRMKSSMSPLGHSSDEAEKRAWSKARESESERRNLLLCFFFSLSFLFDASSFECFFSPASWNQLFFSPRASLLPLPLREPRRGFSRQAHNR